MNTQGERMNESGQTIFFALAGVSPGIPQLEWVIGELRERLAGRGVALEPAAPGPSGGREATHLRIALYPDEEAGRAASLCSVNLPATLPVFVELTGPQGPVFSGEFKLGVREENSNSGTAAERLFISLPEFDVLADGAHTLSVRLLTEGDINLARMEAEIIGGAQAADYSFTSAGLGIFAIGTLLYLISGRRRKKARKESSRRWGRQ